MGHFWRRPAPRSGRNPRQSGARIRAPRRDLDRPAAPRRPPAVLARAGRRPGDRAEHGRRGLQPAGRRGLADRGAGLRHARRASGLSRPSRRRRPASHPDASPGTTCVRARPTCRRSRARHGSRPPGARSPRPPTGRSVTPTRAGCPSCARRSRITCPAPAESGRRLSTWSSARASRRDSGCCARRCARAARARSRSSATPSPPPRAASACGLALAPLDVDDEGAAVEQLGIRRRRAAHPCPPVPDRGAARRAAAGDRGRVGARHPAA